VTLIFPNAIEDIEIPFSNGHTELGPNLPYTAIQNVIFNFPNAVENIEIPSFNGHT